MKPIRGGLLLGVAALLLLALSPAISWAAFPGTNGRIAYAEKQFAFDPPPPPLGHDFEIVSNSPTGGDPIALTDNSREDADPSWSADGRRIVFRRWDGRDWEVWTMRADGTHERQVTANGVHEGPPSFSPGGGRIIMTTNWRTPGGCPLPWCAGSNGNIVSVRTDGTGWRRILRSGRVSSDPSYSPSGRRIVFAGSVSRTARRCGIWKIRRNGSRPRLLTEDCGFPVSMDRPDVSPDGSHIVYERCTYDERNGCWPTTTWLMRGNGTYERALPGGSRISPVFSPTDTRIAAATPGSEGYDRYIATFALDGSDGQWVTELDPNVPYLLQDWSPDWQPIPQP